MVQIVSAAVLIALLLGCAKGVADRRRERIFVISIKPARVIIDKGSFTQKFKNDCLDLYKGKRIYGRVWGIVDNGRIRLCFSDSLDEGFRQRFRNIFPYQSFDWLVKDEPPMPPDRKAI